MGIVDAILALITAAPSALAAIETIYTTVKDTLSSTDQATIDAALADARAKMPAEEAQTDAALAAAEKQ